MKELISEINDSQYVLVGIGSEWKLQNNDKETLLKAYNKLAELLKDKNYYIVTICTDDVIYESDLSKERITAPCGSTKRYQCENACKDVIKLEDEIDLEKDVCPVCGGKYEPNNVTSNNYNEDGYMESWKKYNLWLQGTLNRKLTILELGTDFAYPTVIRWAFEKVAMINQKAHMYRISEKFWQLTEDIKDKAESIKENSVEFVNK